MVQARRQSSRLRKLPPRESSTEVDQGTASVVEDLPPTESPKMSSPIAPTPRKRTSRNQAQPTIDRGHDQFILQAVQEEETQIPMPTAGTRTPTTSNTRDAHTTPQKSIGLTPSGEEMHPAHHHPSTTKKPDDGLVLGFYPMEQETNRPSHSNLAGALAAAQRTPSKVTNSDDHRAYPFTFSPNLVQDQVQLLAELRKQKAIAQGAGQGENEVLAASEDVQRERIIARPKTKSGRFSAAHQAQFNQMPSIANHPSVRRQLKQAAPALQASPVKRSLKRSPSKAELDSANTAAPSQERYPKRPTKIEATPVNKRFKGDKGATSSIPVFLPRPPSAGTPKPTTSMLLRPPVKSSLPRQAGFSQPTTPTNEPAAKIVPSSVKSVRPSLQTPIVRGTQSVRPAEKSTLATLSIRKFPASSTPRPAEKSIVVEVKEPSPDPHTPSIRRRPKACSPPPIPSPSPLKQEDRLLQASPLRPPSRLRPPQAPTLKSILRSPSRSYSVDPSKVAAGTHLTAPTTLFGLLESPSRPRKSVGFPKTKKVDFSASTIAQSERHDNPLVTVEPPTMVRAKGTPRPKASEIPSFEEPADAMSDVSPTPGASLSTLANTPSKDFTFRFGERRITFAPEASAPDDSKISTRKTRKSDITLSKQPFLNDDVFYPVLAPLSAGTKRKVEAILDASGETGVDKENGINHIVGKVAGVVTGHHAATSDDAGTDGDRPAKRARTKTAAPEPKTPESQVRIIKPASQLARTAPVNKSKFSLRESISHFGLGSVTRPARSVGRLTRERLNMLAAPKRPHV